MSLGINFFGPIYSEDGIGEAARSTLQAMLKIGIDVQVNPLPRKTARETVESASEKIHFQTPHLTNYFHFSSRWAPYYFTKLGTKAFKNKYNIGYWVCETMDYPEEWARNAKYYREIWTASSFCQESISRAVPIPVLKVPHPVSDFQFRKTGRTEAGMPEGAFVFLTVANAYSDIERKNLTCVVKSFQQAFSTDEKAALVLKLSNTSLEADYVKSLQSLVDCDPRIRILDGFLDKESLRALYDNADAYVSLHRSEGFGLTLAEAMIARKPVIATAYSGNMDFCNPLNSYLVDFDLVPVGVDRMRYRKDDLWADPKTESAAAQMRLVYTEPSLRAERTERAFRDVTRNFGLDAVGAVIRKRLDLIHRRFEFRNDMSERALKPVNEFALGETGEG